MGVARTTGLQPDFETPAVRQLFHVPTQVVDINDRLAGGQGLKPGSESRLCGGLREIITEDVDRRRHLLRSLF